MRADCKDCVHVGVCGKLIWKEKDGSVVCQDFKDRAKYVVRDKGEWIVECCEAGSCESYPSFIEVRCSVCGFNADLEAGQYGWYYGDQFPWKACPYCAADMRKEEDDAG